ncbi:MULTISPECIES: DUF4258 domain-containing protein [Amniculibacterium]|uniref:DUF4258 domain-containing protein n=1 Tax=Amniculibacterium TaxID=2715289 RepID=UPI000F594378|nr:MULTISPECIES: DUF4258 domain-containing protein [Amniculibacterium]
MKKLKFYLLGFIPGLLVVLFFLNKKGASCSYFPNDRVRAETATKKFSFTPEFQQKMTELKMDEKFIKDSILTKGSIDFDKSKAQAEPCSEYLLVYPKDNPRMEIYFSKCKDDAQFKSLKSLR